MSTARKYSINSTYFYHFISFQKNYKMCWFYCAAHLLANLQCDAMWHCVIILFWYFIIIIIVVSMTWTTSSVIYGACFTLPLLLLIMQCVIPFIFAQHNANWMFSFYNTKNIVSTIIAADICATQSYYTYNIFSMMTTSW